MNALKKEMSAGIYTITEDKYHADPCNKPSLSASIATVLLGRSPHHAWLQHPRLNPYYKPTRKHEFDVGTAAHALFLEGEDKKLCILEFDNFRTKEAQSQRDEAYSNNLTPILTKEYAGIQQMVDVAKQFIETTELAGIFKRGKAEQTIIWKEDNGIWCRGRVDFLPDDKRMFLDYKTTTNAEPNYWIKSHAIDNLIQAAFYAQGLYQLFKINSVPVFLVQENTPPYDCSLIGLSESFLDIGRKRVERAIKLWAECLKSDKWDSYSHQVHYAEPPQWALYEFEQELLHEEMFNGFST